MPGLVVIAPYDAADAKGLMKAAIRCEDPVVFLENELVYGRSFDVPDLDDYVLPIGKARIMREGTDVTIVAYSIAVGLALEAAEELADEGIDAEVIDLRTLRPLDREAILTSLAKTNRLVIAEEGWPTCSIASEVMAICMEDGFDHLDAPVTRVCNEDVPLPYAANLEKLALIDTPRIVAAAKKVCYRVDMEQDQAAAGDLLDECPEVSRIALASAGLGETSGWRPCARRAHRTDGARRDRADARPDAVGMVARSARAPASARPQGDLLLDLIGRTWAGNELRAARAGRRVGSIAWRTSVWRCRHAALHRRERGWLAGWLPVSGQPMRKLAGRKRQDGSGPGRIWPLMPPRTANAIARSIRSAGRARAEGPCALRCAHWL